MKLNKLPANEKHNGKKESLRDKILNELKKLLLNEVEETKKQLEGLKSSMEILNSYNDALKEANKEIRNILSFKGSSFEYVNKVNNLISTLSLQQENPVAKSYLKVLYVLQLREIEQVGIEEIKRWVSNVMDDKNVPYVVKKSLVNWLRENDYLVWDSFSQVEMENYFLQKYPNYNWSNFEQAVSWEWTNTFAQYT